MTLDLAAFPSLSSTSASSDEGEDSKEGYERVGSWRFLRLPKGTSTRRRARKDPKIGAFLSSRFFGFWRFLSVVWVVGAVFGTWVWVPVTALEFVRSSLALHVARSHPAVMEWASELHLLSELSGGPGFWAIDLPLKFGEPSPYSFRYFCVPRYET